MHHHLEPKMIGSPLSFLFLFLFLFFFLFLLFLFCFSHVDGMCLFLTTVSFVYSKERLVYGWEDRWRRNREETKRGQANLEIGR